MDDEDDAPTPQPIERERKPYASAPGGGKNYDDTNPSAPEVKPVIPEPKLGRSLSNAGRGDYPRPRPAPISVHQQKPTSSAPVDIPEPRRHRNSTYYKDQPSAPAPRRTRSPSVSKTNGYGRKSESDHAYGSSYNSVPSVEGTDNARRHRDYDSTREKHASDRFDSARMTAYDPRDRDRGSRTRTRSIAGSRAGYGAEDEYYRSVGGYPTPQSATAAPSRDAHNNYNAIPTPTSAQYPPNAFRESRADDDPGFSRRGQTSTEDTLNAFNRRAELKAQAGNDRDGHSDYARSQPR